MQKLRFWHFPKCPFLGMVHLLDADLKEISYRNVLQNRIMKGLVNIPVKVCFSLLFIT